MQRSQLMTALSPSRVARPTNLRSYAVNLSDADLFADLTNPIALSAHTNRDVSNGAQFLHDNSLQ